MTEILPKKSVLIIEDESALREAIKLKLEKRGITAFAAETGEEGLEILKKEKPDLLWLDMLLPGINGTEVLRAVRANKETEKLKVVVVSVSSGDEKIQEMFRMGALDYIIKSNFSINEIVDKVEKML